MNIMRFLEKNDHMKKKYRNYNAEDQEIFNPNSSPDTLKFKSEDYSFNDYLKIPKTGWDMELTPSVIVMNTKPVNWFHRIMQRLILGFKWIRNGDKPE